MHTLRQKVRKVGKEVGKMLESLVDDSEIVYTTEMFSMWKEGVEGEAQITKITLKERGLFGFYFRESKQTKKRLLMKKEVMLDGV